MMMNAVLLRRLTADHAGRALVLLLADRAQGPVPDQLRGQVVVDIDEGGRRGEPHARFDLRVVP